MTMEFAYSNLTDKVLSFSEVPRFDMDDCVDWALDMLKLGHETPSLLILASLSKPTNYFETVEYLKDAVNELKLELKTGEDAILSYSSFYIKKLAQTIHVKENLKTLCEFCQTQDYEKSIYDFYLLYWAWDDLDCGIEYQSYWPNATIENIESIVTNTAKNWLDLNKKHYA